MAFTPKDWVDGSGGGTPITAAALEDLEARLSTYTDTAAPALGPTTSARNVVQPSATSVRPFTVKAQSAQYADLLRVEKSDGTPWLRFGSGGLENIPIENASFSTSTINPQLTVYGEGSGGGIIGVRDAADSAELKMESIVNAASGAGPHLFLDVGIGRAASEYWYTEIVHKKNRLHKHAQGLEHFDATHEHYFFGPIHTDDGAGNLTYSYTFATDIATGLTIFNPDVNAPPYTYTALMELRSKGASTPVLWVTGATSQTGNLQEWRSTSATLMSVTSSGVPRWNATANQQTTVGAQGTASAIPGTSSQPTKWLKVQDSAGTVLVVPAYAAT